MSMKEPVRFVTDKDELIEILKEENYNLIKENLESNVEHMNDLEKCRQSVADSNKKIQSIVMSGGTNSKIVGSLNANPVNKIIKEKSHR